MAFPHTITEVEVERVLKSEPSRWHKQISADLISEMEAFIGKVDTLPDMRAALAAAGFNGLHDRIKKAISGKSGVEALRAMCHAMRSFALGSPGLAAATFRNPNVESVEWREAGAPLLQTVLAVFAEVELTGPHAIHAVRILRSLVRGFVLTEMSASNAQPIEFQRSYVLAVDQFIYGLPVLRDIAQAEIDTQMSATQDVNEE